jgi:hypothetical protein
MEKITLLRHSTGIIEFLNILWVTRLTSTRTEGIRGYLHVEENTVWATDGYRIHITFTKTWRLRPGKYLVLHKTKTQIELLYISEPDPALWKQLTQYFPEHKNFKEIPVHYYGRERGHHLAQAYTIVVRNIDDTVTISPKYMREAIPEHGGELRLVKYQDDKNNMPVILTDQKDKIAAIMPLSMGER